MTPLAPLLAERMRRFGPMTFAEYMRECLYHPIHGYYSKGEASRFVDYYTSVDVHPVFGRLLARQFAEMWERMDRPAEFTLVEAGAGVGRLAGHILDFVRAKFPEFHQSLRYVAVERSPARCDQLSARLARYAAEGRCTPSLEIPAHIPAGCIFSNELMDALPVHRVVMQNASLQEICVVSGTTGFVETLTPLSTCAINDFFASQQVSLEEGQQAEASLEACDWIMEVGRRLDRGFVLTIDYGHEAADLYDARHQRGTVLAYANHQVSEDYYAAPGEQDLTAHVNFTALKLWGEKAGLLPVGFASQTAFLMALGRGNEFADLYDEGQSETQRVRARLQLKTLIYPEGMGERFHVFAQHKGIPHAMLTGFAGF